MTSSPASSSGSRPAGSRRRQSRFPRRRHIGMRVWLAAGFTLVCFLTAGILYSFITSKSQDVLNERSTELAVGRTVRLADRLSQPDVDAKAELEAANGEGYTAWFFDSDGNLVAPENPRAEFSSSKPYQETLDLALEGGRPSRDLKGGEIAVVGIPVTDFGTIEGAVVGRYSRPIVIRSAIDKLRSESLRAALIAILIGTLVGVGIASVITGRLKGIAAKADDLASGNFDVRLPIRGRDEIRLGSFQSLAGEEIRGRWTGVPMPPKAPLPVTPAAAARPADIEMEIAAPGDDGGADLDALLAGLGSDAGEGEGGDADLDALLAGLGGADDTGGDDADLDALLAGFDDAGTGPSDDGGMDPELAALLEGL